MPQWYSFAGIMIWQPVEAQTYNQAATDALQNDVCTQLSLGTQLGIICGQLQARGVFAASGVDTQSQPNAILIAQQQLKDQQTKEEREEMHQGGSADTVVSRWGEKFSTFLTAGATTLYHRGNGFEQAYNATIPSVTVGGGYHISDVLETGLAFNYSNSNADNDTGGGFNTNSYSPLLYIGYLPFDDAFANLVLGYTRQNQTNNRVAVAGTNNTGNQISGFTTGNINANQ